ncbi:MAG: HEPN domain-containing protein [Candidatus Hatepunaea meridiana]|nr:HEPN domain-containing protein [Candidatus Hatepunaea meridiana]
MDEGINKEVQAWFDRADEDLMTVNTLLTHEKRATSAICFHSQQLAEKALKAYLIAHGKHIERTHDLTRLVDLCAELDPEFTSLEEIGDKISFYAVEIRYPDNWIPIPLNKAKDAFSKAKRIYDFVKIKLDPTILI